MNLKFDIFKAMSGILMLAAVSCSDDNSGQPGGSTATETEVTFTISVADIPDGAVSRATPTDGPYDPGEGYENYIDLLNDDFRFYFLTSDNKYFGQIYDIRVLPVASSPGSKTYKVHGHINADQAAMTTFKVCAVANWGNNYPDLADGDDISKLWTNDKAIYNYNSSPLSATNIIPLYGIREFSGVTFQPLLTTELGNMHLLRAFAKVEIELTPSVTGVQSVTLTRVNSLGYKAPKDIDTEDKYVHNHYEPDYVNTPYIPAGAEVLTDVEMRCVEGNPGEMETRRFVAYVPEYDNTGDGAVQSRIHLTYTDNPFVKEDYVDFKYYQASGSHKKDEPFDLLRNYWYKIRVTQDFIVVDVQPYALADLKPDFGLERDNDGNIIIRNSKGEIIRIIMTDGSELTFKPFDIPNIGEANGVFENDGSILIAYLEDGRRIVYTYSNVTTHNSTTDKDETQKKQIRWELYSAATDPYDVHIVEEFESWRFDWATSSWFNINCHSLYDERGCLIQRHLYKSEEHFESRPAGGESPDATKTVDYKTVDSDGNPLKDREKDIFYYHDGKVFMILHVRWAKVPAKDDDGHPIEGQFVDKLVETYENVNN